MEKKDMVLIAGIKAIEAFFYSIGEQLARGTQQKEETIIDIEIEEKKEKKK